MREVGWLQRSRENGPGGILFQVSVERHRKVAQEDPAQGRSPDLFGSELDQAIFDAGSQTLQRLGEVVVEPNAELPLDLALDEHTVAKQVLDHRAAQIIVSGKAESPEGRRAV